jgi:hypothetical protein
MKPMKKQNWDSFAIAMNIHFPSDVQCTWGQCRDKFNNMNNKYNVVKKKTDITIALPLDWPWYERFDCLFGGTTKIVGIPPGVDQGVRTIHKEIEILDTTSSLIKI